MKYTEKEVLQFVEEKRRKVRKAHVLRYIRFAKDYLCYSRRAAENIQRGTYL